MLPKITDVTDERGEIEQWFIERIALIESNANPFAKARTSSATGMYQFINSTWLIMINRYAKELTEGRSSEEVLEMRKCPYVSTLVFKGFTKANIKYLMDRNIGVTPGRVYLAHFLGARGAVKALSANKEELVSNVLGSRIVRANKFLRGKTIGYLEEWANRKIGR